MQRRDGSLTLYIQHEAPEGEERANWTTQLVLAVRLPARAIAFGIGGRDIAARKLVEWINSERSQSDSIKKLAKTAED